MTDYTGGSFNNDPANVGLFSLNGNNTLGNTNANYGFRLASDKARRRAAKAVRPVLVLWGRHPDRRVEDQQSVAASSELAVCERGGISTMDREKDHAENTRRSVRPNH